MFHLQLSPAINGHPNRKGTLHADGRDVAPTCKVPIEKVETAEREECFVLVYRSRLDIRTGRARRFDIDVPRVRRLDVYVGRVHGDVGSGPPAPISTEKEWHHHCDKYLAAMSVLPESAKKACGATLSQAIGGV